MGTKTPVPPPDCEPPDPPPAPPRKRTVGEHVANWMREKGIDGGESECWLVICNRDDGQLPDPINAQQLHIFQSPKTASSYRDYAEQKHCYPGAFGVYRALIRVIEKVED